MVVAEDSAEWIASSRQPPPSPSVLQLPAVVGPMQQGLPLFATAIEIALAAILLDLGDVPPHGLPAANLPGVVGAAAAHVVAAVPLEPAARVFVIDPALLLPIPKRLRGVDLEEVQLRDRAARGRVLAPANHALGNSPVQSVMYLPPKTPRASISAGVSSGVNSGSKFSPTGSVRK